MGKFADLLGNSNPPSLAEISQSWRQCQKCYFWQIRTQVVPFSGSEASHLLVVGQSPGPEEDRQGELFIGRSGADVRQAISRYCKVDPADVLFCNVIACACPGYVRSEFVKNCRDLLDGIIIAARPSVVLSLGSQAAKRFGCRQKLSGPSLPPYSYGTTIVVSTFHPAALYRDIPEEEKQRIRSNLRESFVVAGRLLRRSLEMKEDR